MIPRLTAISIKTNWYKVIEGLYAIAKCLHVAVTQRNPRRRTNRLAQFLAWPRIRAPRERERERERLFLRHEGRAGLRGSRDERGRNGWDRVGKEEQG
jgi:hypothetical protein